jgi:hypothetical protein
MSRARASATIVLIYPKERDVDDEIGAGFWLKLVGLAFAVGIGGMLIFLLLDAAWYRWGALGALLFFSGLLLVYGYIYDRRHAKAYAADLET